MISPTSQSYGGATVNTQAISATSWTQQWTKQWSCWSSHGYPGRRRCCLGSLVDPIWMRATSNYPSGRRFGRPEMVLTIGKIFLLVREDHGTSSSPEYGSARAIKYVTEQIRKRRLGIWNHWMIKRDEVLYLWFNLKLEQCNLNLINAVYLTFGFNVNCCCEAEIGCNSPQQQSSAGQHSANINWEICERPLVAARWA